MRYLIIIYFFTGLIFTSCSYKQDQALFEEKNPVQQQQSDANVTNYHIKPQDILQITNIQNNKNIVDANAGVTVGGALTSAGATTGDNYLVEDDGTIALPSIGRVKIAGLTRVEARKYIEELYSKELKSPLLEVKIINLKVSLTGEVKSPGNILLTKDRTTLIEVLGDAGGLTEKGDEKHIKIIRNQNSQVDIIDLSDIKTLKDPRIFLQNNDIVYVPQNKKAIRNNGIQNFSTIAQPVLLIFSTTLLIFTLVRK